MGSQHAGQCSPCSFSLQRYHLSTHPHLLPHPCLFHPARRRRARVCVRPLRPACTGGGPARVPDPSAAAVWRLHARRPLRSGEQATVWGGAFSCCLTWVLLALRVVEAVSSRTPMNAHTGGHTHALPRSCPCRPRAQTSPPAPPPRLPAPSPPPSPTPPLPPPSPSSPPPPPSPPRPPPRRAHPPPPRARWAPRRASGGDGCAFTSCCRLLGRALSNLPFACLTHPCMPNPACRQLPPAAAPLPRLLPPPRPAPSMVPPPPRLLPLPRPPLTTAAPPLSPWLTPRLPLMMVLPPLRMPRWVRVVGSWSKVWVGGGQQARDRLTD